MRGSIILGASIIQPVPGNPRRSKLTMITQVDPGGFTPPMIVNQVFYIIIANINVGVLFCFCQLCAMGPIGFMKNIEIAANRKPSKSVLQEKQRLAQELLASNKSGASKSAITATQQQQRMGVKPIFKGK